MARCTSESQNSLTMKSAFELAMERLEKESPTQELSDEQKAKLSELSKIYESSGRFLDAV